MNDKIYEAAPGASARARRAGDRLVPRGHRRPRARDARLAAEGHRARSRDRRASSRSWSTRGFAYPVEGDVYFRVARFADYGRLSGQRPDQVEEQEPNPLKEDPRDFALWKATKLGEDTHWDSPWGEGRPGWHIECSAMAEELLGPRVRDPRRRARPRLPAPRERARAVAGARPRVRRTSGRTTGCSSSPARRCRSRSGTSPTIREVLDRVGARDGARLLPRRPLAQADRLLGGDDGAGGGAGREASATSSAGPSERGRRLGRVRRGARRRLQHAGGARADARAGATTSCCARGARGLRPRVARRRRSGAARDRRSSPSGGVARARRARLRAGRPRCAARSRPPAGRCATSPAAGTRSSASGDPRPRLRAAGRARGAARPARGARALGDRARGRLASRGSRRRGRSVEPERELTELAGTRDHQGVVARVEPYRYADAYELAAVERPLLAVLDQVTDPRNLGAVCRSAEGAGRDRRRSCRRTAPPS